MASVCAQTCEGVNGFFASLSSRGAGTPHSARTEAPGPKMPETTMLQMKQAVRTCLGVRGTAPALRSILLCPKSAKVLCTVSIGRRAVIAAKSAKTYLISRLNAEDPSGSPIALTQGKAKV